MGCRVTAVDGLRGVLATLVVIDHALAECGSHALGIVADISVAAFFTISGYVLTRGWDGAFGAFLARRFIRLWPVFALALSAGYLLARRAPEPLELVWIPLPRYDANEICPPAWSLFIEAWAALAMPVIAWSGHGRPWRWLACTGGLVALDCVWIPDDLAVRAFACYLVWFFVGAGLSRRVLRSEVLDHPFAQFLGRISYSLYITHWLVLRCASNMLGVTGVVAGIPVAFGVAWLVHRWVERPSIRLSHFIARVAVA